MPNILRCKKCGDIITSRHTHDMNWCKCGAIAIDGGDDYCKITGNPEDIEVFVPSKLIEEKDLRIEELESQFAYECECNKQFVECQNENAKLKQQLAEKDVKIKALNQMNLLLESDVQVAVKIQNRHNQDKISFCIEKLEKVKKYAQHIQGKFINYIDDQIKAIKEMK